MQRPDDREVLKRKRWGEVGRGHSRRQEQWIRAYPKVCAGNAKNSVCREPRAWA